MKNSILFAMAAILLFVACRKADDFTVDNGDCVLQFVKQNKLKPYTPKAYNECRFMYLLYEFAAQQWFVLDNPCADMISIPIDCYGNPLVGSVEDPYLTEFYRHAVFQKIVGIVP